MLICQLKIRIEKKTRSNMPQRMAIEQIIPLADTGTGFWNTSVNRNQGRGRLKSRSFELSVDFLEAAEHKLVS